MLGRRSPKKKTVVKLTVRLKLLHRRRINIQGSVNVIKAFNEEYVADQRDQVPVRIQCLDALWQDYEETQEEIEVLEDGGDEFLEERSEFLSMYLELKAALQAKIPPPPAVDCVRPPPPVAQPSTHVRLPEIKLKEFSGDVDNWVSFRDLFQSLIHLNPQLSAVQKLHYLRATLTGEAARIISSLEISANNYTVAWNLLKERYENPRMLIKRHMSGLLSILPMKKESAQGLVELVDEFDRHVQLLDKLEEVESHWNSFLVERLSSYLDTLSLREWETYVSKENDRPTYQGLVAFVHQRSRILQTLKLSQAGNAQPETKTQKPRLASNHVASENIMKCPRCTEAHWLFKCDLFKELIPSQRFEFVKKHGLCINCMKGPHLAKNCSSGSCSTCAKKHHTLLHLPPRSGRPGGTLSSSATNQQTTILASQHAECSSQTSSTTPVVSNTVVAGSSDVASSA